MNLQEYHKGIHTQLTHMVDLLLMYAAIKLPQEKKKKSMPKQDNSRLSRMTEYFISILLHHRNSASLR
jgi:hypothetical protein